MVETAEGRSPGAGDTGLDHVTVVVRDLERAVALFDRLGLEETTRVVVAGKTMARYIDIPGWEADHVTLVHREAPARHGGLSLGPGQRGHGGTSAL